MEPTLRKGKTGNIIPINTTSLVFKNIISTKCERICSRYIKEKDYFMYKYYLN